MTLTQNSSFKLKETPEQMGIIGTEAKKKCQEDIEDAFLYQQNRRHEEQAKWRVSKCE